MPGIEPPSQRDFGIAFHDVGLTLYHVYNVRIVDLTLRHFRLDGVSAHSLCRNIVLENVTSTGNGRAGLFVGGTSGVEAVNCTLSGNRRHELLIRGRHAVARVTPEPKHLQKFID